MSKSLLNRSVGHCKTLIRVWAGGGMRKFRVSGISKSRELTWRRSAAISKSQLI